jgi:hypothetical protein
LRNATEKNLTGRENVVRDGRTRNANRILAEKYEDKKQSGRQIQRK